MRFINTQTLCFEEVADSKLSTGDNKYAIFSHRWGNANDEISFADINESRDFFNKPGFAKLKGFCDKAASLGYRYGWADMCCINKGDSSELTEAINSMYRWYQASDLCIVYLEDVPRKPMLSSGWFDRGWTLQELIGPKSADFYDCGWNLLGTKMELLAELSAKTEVPQDVLSHDASPATCSIAQRMSWAAKRDTTRIEDKAYSLLGIFGVNMPQIYGEREKAFLRLQREIIKQSKDESIFAWDMPIGEVRNTTNTGLFAPDPSSFIDCSGVVSIRGSTGFNETNGELCIALKTFPHSMETYYAVLNCTEASQPNHRITILLSRVSAENENEFVRVNKTFAGGRTLTSLASIDYFTDRQIRVSLDPDERPINQAYGFWLRMIEPPGHTDCQIRALPRRGHEQLDKLQLAEKDWGTAGIIYIKPKVKEDLDNYNYYSIDQKGWSRVRWIKLGFDEEFNPMLLLANDRGPINAGMTKLNQQENLFEEAMWSEPDSQARKEIFNNIWISSQAGVPSRSLGWASGISILKVDKKKGLSGYLDGLNLGISIQLVPDLSPHTRSISNHESLIWVVDITDTGGSDPEKDVKQSNKNFSSDQTWGSCFACWCSRDCETTEIDEEASKRSALRNQKKVLTAADLK